MSFWQLLLSPRPRNRTDVSARKSIEGESGAILYEFLGRDEKTGEVIIRETHKWAYEKVRKGLSGPPLHIHLRQSERFMVKKGKLGIEHNEAKFTMTPESDPVVVKPGARHRFFPHPTSGEDVVFEFSVDPEKGEIDAGLDEDFIRNFATYFMDCEREGVSPSVFQILVYGWNADTVISPPFFVPIVILKMMHFVFAYLIGGLLLGYRPYYKEYSRAIGIAEVKKAI